MTSKIIVTGSGKCGTSFMVYLLTELGFDTGYTSEGLREDPTGCEWTVRGKRDGCVICSCMDISKIRLYIVRNSY